MSITFDETLRAIGFLAGHNCDWLGAVNEREDKTFTLTYRFRYYDGDKTKDPHEDGDTKRWQALRSPPGVSCEQAIESFMSLMDTLTSAGFCLSGVEPYKLTRGERSFEEFIKEFEKAPFVHKKAVH